MSKFSKYLFLFLQVPARYKYFSPVLLDIISVSRSVCMLNRDGACCTRFQENICDFAQKKHWKWADWHLTNCVTFPRCFFFFWIYLKKTSLKITEIDSVWRFLQCVSHFQPFFKICLVGSLRGPRRVDGNVCVKLRRIYSSSSPLC